MASKYSANATPGGSRASDLEEKGQLPQGVSQQTWDSLSQTTIDEVNNLGGLNEWLDDVGRMFTDGNPFSNHAEEIQDLDGEFNRAILDMDEAKARDFGRMIDLEMEMGDIVRNTRDSTNPDELLKAADEYFKLDDEILELYHKYY